MTDFTAGYRPPGITIDAESTGAIGAVGVNDTVLCLVGDGIGYETFTDNVSFATSTTAVLSKSGAIPTSIVVSAVTDTGPVTYVADTTSPAVTNDYSVTQTNGITTITRHSSGTIPTDRLVTITYRYADDDYFALHRYEEYVTLAQTYGPALDPSTGAVASPLSFAAQQAFRNGANVVYCIARDNRGSHSTDTDAELFSATYARILPNFEINVIVPLLTPAVDEATASTLISDVSAFLNSASGQNFPMMAICGVMRTYPTADPDTIAQTIANRRVVLVWPQALSFTNPVTNVADQVDGIYVAAGWAGVLAANDPNRGLTRSSIKGFSGIPAALSNLATLSKKNQWSSRGVAVAELSRTGQLWIRHGVTTDVSDIGNREISVVRCQDVVYETMQLTLEGADLIGDPITVNTPLMIQSLVIGALEQCKTDLVINDYTAVVVTQGSAPGGSPTDVRISFSYTPIYPLNNIDMTFLLDLTQNTLTTADAAA